MFLGHLGSQASTEMFFNYAKVCYFLGWVFHVFKDKMNEKIYFLYMVRTKKLHNIKSRKKNLILWGQNRLMLKFECTLISLINVEVGINMEGRIF